MSLLTNQCDVGSVLRGQVSLTVVNHIPVLSCGYEQVKKIKDSLMLALKMLIRVII